MSSSDIPARLFLRHFAYALAGFAALALALTWAIDPLSLLRQYGGGRLCAPGIKSPAPREAKLAAAIARQPRDVLIGSSRVKFGFSPADAQRLLGGRAFNLGFNNASPAQERRALAALVERAPIGRVWLAAEFGTVTDQFWEDRPIRPPSRLDMPLFAWREGLVSPVALQASVATLIRPALCETPPFDEDGFFTGPTGGIAGGGQRVVERMEGGPDHADSLDERRYPARMQELRLTAELLQKSGVRLVLFLSPMSETYRRAITRSGRSDLYRRWREDVRSVALETGAELIEADTDAFLETIPARCPPGATREQCLFYDPVHFRTEVGAAILASGTRRSETGARTG